MSVSHVLHRMTSNLTNLCYTQRHNSNVHRCTVNGIELITTKKYIATCESNIGLPKWCDPSINFFNRWKALHTPLGLNIKEYKIFRKRFWPKNYIMSILKVYLRCLVPSFYNKISGNAK